MSDSRLEDIKKGVDEYFGDLNRRYPNRHRQIHKVHCNGCPSSYGMDPESEDISKFPKELIAKEFLFVCYKRESKLCKGLCDNMKIDQEYLNQLYED